MIPLHVYPNSRRDPDAQSEMSVTSTASATAHKPPSIQSAAKARVYRWSRRIIITTESLWLKKIRRNKFKTFIFIFVPSVFIFLLAFSLSPPRAFSNSNNLMFYMGGIMRPDIMFTSGVMPKRFHSARDCEFVSSFRRLRGALTTNNCILMRYGTTAFDVRYTPLLASLGYGATSIEIYLWLRDGVLYVSLGLLRSLDATAQ
jgi:hypothetical protein